MSLESHYATLVHKEESLNKGDVYNAEIPSSLFIRMASLSDLEGLFSKTTKLLLSV